MFDQMKAMGAVAGLLRDKERLAEISQRVQDTLGTVSAWSASPGGGPCAWWYPAR